MFMYVPLCLHIVFCYQTQTTFILKNSNKKYASSFCFILLVSLCSRPVVWLHHSPTEMLSFLPICASHPSHSRLLSSDFCCVKQAGTGIRANPKTESLKTIWAPKTFFTHCSPTGTWRDLVTLPAPINRCYFDCGGQNLPNLALFLFLHLQPCPSLS